MLYKLNKDEYITLINRFNKKYRFWVFFLLKDGNCFFDIRGTEDNVEKT